MRGGHFRFCCLFGGCGELPPEEGIAKLHHKRLDQPRYTVEPFARLPQILVQIAAPVDLKLDRMHASAWRSVSLDDVAPGKRLVGTSGIAMAFRYPAGVVR